MEWLVPDLIPAEGSPSSVRRWDSQVLLPSPTGERLALGTPFLGRETSGKRPSHRLEDSDRRINSGFINSTCSNQAAPDLHEVATRQEGTRRPPPDPHAVQRKARHTINTVIIDPIVKFIDLIDFSGDYGGAYGALSPIKEALDAKHVAGVFAHHCARASLSLTPSTPSSAPQDRAVCDTRLVLNRKRGSDDAILVAGGRDVLHSESALHFDTASGWNYQGTAQEVGMSKERKEIIAILDDLGPLTSARNR